MPLFCVPPSTVRFTSTVSASFCHYLCSTFRSFCRSAFTGDCVHRSLFRWISGLRSFSLALSIRSFLDVRSVSFYLISFSFVRSVGFFSQFLFSGFSFVRSFLIRSVFVRSFVVRYSGRFYVLCSAFGRFVRSPGRSFVRFGSFVLSGSVLVWFGSFLVGGSALRYRLVCQLPAVCFVLRSTLTVWFYVPAVLPLIFWSLRSAFVRYGSRFVVFRRPGLVRSFSPFLSGRSCCVLVAGFYVSPFLLVRTFLLVCSIFSVLVRSTFVLRSVLDSTFDVRSLQVAFVLMFRSWMGAGLPFRSLVVRSFLSVVRWAFVRSFSFVCSFGLVLPTDRFVHGWFVHAFCSFSFTVVPAFVIGLFVLLFVLWSFSRSLVVLDGSFVRCSGSFTGRVLVVPGSFGVHRSAFVSWTFFRSGFVTRCSFVSRSRSAFWVTGWFAFVRRVRSYSPFWFRSVVRSCSFLRSVRSRSTGSCLLRSAAFYLVLPFFHSFVRSFAFVHRSFIPGRSFVCSVVLVVSFGRSHRSCLVRSGTFVGRFVHLFVRFLLVPRSCFTVSVRFTVRSFEFVSFVHVHTSSRSWVDFLFWSHVLVRSFVRSGSHWVSFGWFLSLFRSSVFVSGSFVPGCSHLVVRSCILHVLWFLPLKVLDTTAVLRSVLPFVGSAGSLVRSARFCFCSALSFCWFLYVRSSCWTFSFVWIPFWISWMRFRSFHRSVLVAAGCPFVPFFWFGFTVTPFKMRFRSGYRYVLPFWKIPLHRSVLLISFVSVAGSFLPFC